MHGNIHGIVMSQGLFLKSRFIITFCLCILQTCLLCYLTFDTGGVGCVVLATNLKTEVLTPDDLQALFGTYGHVMRVQILAKVCYFEEGWPWCA